MFELRWKYYIKCFPFLQCNLAWVQTEGMTITAIFLYRGHLYRFDDFLTAWSEKLRAKEPTSMTVRLQKDVDKYKVKTDPVT